MWNDLKCFFGQHAWNYWNEDVLVQCNDYGIRTLHILHRYCTHCPVKQSQMLKIKQRGT